MNEEVKVSQDQQKQSEPYTEAEEEIVLTLIKGTRMTQLS